MLEAGYELARELACSGEGCELPIRSPPNRKRDPSRIGYVSLLFNLDLGLSIQGLFLVLLHMLMTFALPLQIKMTQLKRLKLLLLLLIEMV